MDLLNPLILYNARAPLAKARASNPSNVTSFLVARLPEASNGSDGGSPPGREAKLLLRCLESLAARCRHVLAVADRRCGGPADLRRAPRRIPGRAACERLQGQRARKLHIKLRVFSSQVRSLLRQRSNPHLLIRRLDFVPVDHFCRVEPEERRAFVRDVREWLRQAPLPPAQRPSTAAQTLRRERWQSFVPYSLQP